MKNWGEIKQATLHKLFLTESEASQQQYLEKFQYLANECLNIIANRVKPKIRAFRFAAVDVLEGREFKVENGAITYIDKYGKKQETEIRTDLIYRDIEDYIYGVNGLVKASESETKLYYCNDIIPLPEDFLSFSDTINYVDGTPDPTIIYVPGAGIKVGGHGNYVIYYNGLWDSIPSKVADNTILNIDASVLNCLPTYIASQLLAQDDIQRSSILKNEFELLLAGLDTTIMYESNHYKSTGGWY